MTSAPATTNERDQAEGVGGEVGGDRFDVRRASRADGLLATWNEAGVLVAADVTVARRLAALLGEPDPTVALAVALAVRAPRLGHVCVDLDRARATISAETVADSAAHQSPAALPWPDQEPWSTALRASPLVACGEEGDLARPLRLAGSRLYLTRYWQEEREVARDLAARAAHPAPGVDVAALRGGLDRLFVADDLPDQRLAAATAVLRRLTVVAGGPGTGKTTTVARILALVCEQAEAIGAAPPRLALAAPTGRAAARLGQSVQTEAAELDVSAAVRARLQGVEAVTLHRLLGWRADRASRFRHDRDNRLPHDVVVVDETSMVSLSLMARLVEAAREGARLVLVGDPRQLASVEAGAVLGDIVGPAAAGPLLRPAARAALGAAHGSPLPEEIGEGTSAIGDGIVLLRRVHRFGGGIAALADAVRRGDPDGVVEVLAAGGESDVRWIGHPDDGPAADADLSAVRERVVERARVLVLAAREERAAEATAALDAFRVLCAHRRGPAGVSAWARRIEGWLAQALEGYGLGGRWYPGRPLLVTRNDDALRLANGDAGVVIFAGGRPLAAFARQDGLTTVSPGRLGTVETVHAMTVHKAQGSQFDEVVVVLPEPDSPILTRELCYTALTRARHRLVVVASEAAIRAGVSRPIARASGLGDRLWGP